MKETVLQLLHEYPHLALLISLTISILIAVVGIIPSVFITAANILFFGFWKGTVISFAGEAIGAMVAFILYRKGFRKAATTKLHKYPKVRALIEAENTKAFLLIISLRLLPFVPSGLVTFTAAIGRVHIFIFLLASSLGKIPALIIEAYSVQQVAKFDWEGKLILIIIALALLFFIVSSSRKK